MANKIKDAVQQARDSYFKYHDVIKNSPTVPSDDQIRAVVKAHKGPLVPLFSGIADAYKLRADYMNSPAGIAMETMEGLPAAVKQVGGAVKGAVAGAGRRLTSNGFMPGATPPTNP